MHEYISQAIMILNSVDSDEKAIKEAKELFNNLDKTSGITDLVSDPKLTNAINLLTPFVVNYKVNQVIKLLQEVAKENKRVDPNTGYRKLIV